VKKQLGVAAFVLFALSLSGCIQAEAAGDDAIAMSLSSTNMVLAVCESMHVDSLRMEERSPNSNWQPVWTVKESFDVEAGQTLSPTGVADIDLPAGAEPQVGRAGQQIAVQLVDQKDGKTLYAVFDVGVAPSEGVWLHPDGSLTSNPCISRD